MLAMRAVGASDRRRSHKSPKLGKSTASSSPIRVNCLAREAGSQYSAGRALVVAVLRREVLPAPLSIPPDGLGVARELHIGQVEASATPAEPGVSELVVDDGQGLAA